MSYALNSYLLTYLLCSITQFSLAHPLCVRSSSVLWQIHGVNERPQRARDVCFSTWKLDEKDGVLQFFMCIVTVQMKLDRRTITEDYYCYSRLV